MFLKNSRLVKWYKNKMLERKKAGYSAIGKTGENEAAKYTLGEEKAVEYLKKVKKNPKDFEAPLPGKYKDPGFRAVRDVHTRDKLIQYDMCRL